MLHTLIIASMAATPACQALQKLPHREPARELALSWRRPRRLLFGEGREWVVVRLPSFEVSSVTLPEGYKAETGAVSPDGRTLAFSAPLDGTERLFTYPVMAPTGARPVEIGERRGRHADPAFSEDGRWIYFAHAPELDGAPGRHSMGVYAQVYRVPAQGGALEAMTDEPGCHTAFASSGHRMALVHSNCHGSKVIKLLDWSTGRFTQLIDGASQATETELSPDGRFALTPEPSNVDMKLERRELGRAGARVTLARVGFSNRLRAQFGLAPSEAYFQANRVVSLAAIGNPPVPVCALSQQEVRR